MTTDGWFNMLFVSLGVLGFTLPFMVYFEDVYKGRRAFVIPIIGPIKRCLGRLFRIDAEKEQGASAEPPKSAH
jgi:hypothetical protein